MKGQCKCEHKSQDELYGKQVRIFNICNKGSRCTVCGTVKGEVVKTLKK